MWRASAEVDRARRHSPGGERNRLSLALTLKQGGNLLSSSGRNDLDVETLSSLEAALLEV